MHELDLLALSSKRPEGLGTVLLEAMACERCVITFAEGGPLDIVSDRINGLLVPPGDIHGLAAAMVKPANDPKLRKALGVEGRKTVERSFRSEMAAAAIEEVYRQITR